MNALQCAGLTLLDVMAVHAGCTYVSDLKYIDEVQRTRLLYKLERIQPEMVSLQEWNDALSYLAGGQAACTQVDARRHLLDAMRVQSDSVGERSVGN